MLVPCTAFDQRRISHGRMRFSAIDATVLPKNDRLPDQRGLGTDSRASNRICNYGLEVAGFTASDKDSRRRRRFRWRRSAVRLLMKRDQDCGSLAPGRKGGVRARVSSAARHGALYEDFASSDASSYCLFGCLFNWMPLLRTASSSLMLFRIFVRRFAYGRTPQLNRFIKGWATIGSKPNSRLATTKPPIQTH